jgi:phospholipid N-methyltransferase
LLVFIRATTAALVFEPQFEHKTKPIGATSNTASKQANIIMKLNICFLALTLVVSLGHAAGVYTDEEVRSGNKANARSFY